MATSTAPVEFQPLPTTREERGRQIARQGGIRKLGGRYVVPSQSANTNTPTYVVDLVEQTTATDAVLRILSVPRDFPWLTMRDIIAIGADCGRSLALNAVASALANLEPDGFVEVCRDRRPYRYRGCP